MNPLDPANSGEQRLFQRSAERHVPVNGSIEVSPLCNMNCDMCFIHLSREEMEAHGRLRTAEEWLSIAEQMKEARVLFLLLTGGEPLLYPGFQELSQELELHCSIDPYMMPAMRERGCAYNFDARVSPEEAARYAHEIHRAHEGDAEAFRAYCRDKLRLVDAAARYFDEHPEAKRAERADCLAGRCSFSLNWQGELRPCVILTAPAANAFELGFMEAWKQVMAGMETLLLNEDCSVCPRRSLCEICPASALYETGSHAGKPDYLCRYTAELERLMRREFE